MAAALVALVGSSHSATSGDEVAYTGSGFTPDTTITLRLRPASHGVPVAQPAAGGITPAHHTDTVTADTHGRIRGIITLPAHLATGEYQLVATATGTHTATTQTITVTEPPSSITLPPSSITLPPVSITVPSLPTPGSPS